MSLVWSPGLIGRFERATGVADAVRRAGRLLVAAGAATEDYVEAMVAREAEQPTGLPARVPFALAHSDGPGALRLAAAIAVFEHPVPFRRMDDPAVELPVRIVGALSVPDRGHQASQLSGLIRVLADERIATALLEADPEAAWRSLSEAAASPVGKG